jgi:hypothetical protein
MGRRVSSSTRSNASRIEQELMRPPPMLHFRTTRCGEEPLCKPGDIEGVDIIPNLFSLVAINIVAATFYIHSDQVT